jgi:hypothetical protein
VQALLCETVVPPCRGKERLPASRAAPEGQSKARKKLDANQKTTNAVKQNCRTVSSLVTFRASAIKKSIVGNPPNGAKRANARLRRYSRQAGA